MPRKNVIVLDTNVFVSGLLTPHAVPGQILSLFCSRHFDVATSDEQLREVRRVLRRPSLLRALPKGSPRKVVEYFLLFKQLSQLYNPPKLEWEFSDKSDHFLLDLAVHAQADFLVTGDKALRKLNLVGECVVVSPIEFLSSA